ncbi:MAG: hypothetical protein ACRDS1_16615 [Pseudonocardiaceae bacterium]
MPTRPIRHAVEHVFGNSCLEWPQLPVIAPLEKVIDCLAEDLPGVVALVRWP